MNYPREVSLEADLGEANQLRVVIKGITSYTRRDTLGPLSNGAFDIRTVYRGMWWWQMGKQHNAFVDKMDYEDPFSQQMQSVDARGKVTAKLSFDRGFSYIVEINENNATQPTRVKQIQVE